MFQDEISKLRAQRDKINMVLEAYDRIQHAQAHIEQCNTIIKKAVEDAGFTENVKDVTDAITDSLAVMTTAAVALEPFKPVVVEKPPVVEEPPIVEDVIP